MTPRLTLTRQLRSLTTQTRLLQTQTMPSTVHTPPPHPPSSPFVTAEAKDAIKLWHKYADVPHPTRWQEQNRYKMCIGHLLIMSLLEHTYLFAPQAVETGDLANYLGYAEVAFANLWNHHTVEETISFPQWTKAAQSDIWEKNVEQHHLFESALALSWVYVRHARSALSPKPPPSPVPAPGADVINVANSAKAQFPELDFEKPFNARALRKQMEVWLPVATKHMADEIDTLSPEWMERVGQEALNRSGAELMKAMKAEGPHWALCSAFSALPLETIRKLIPLPLPVRKIILPFIFAGRYWDYWKYSAYPENLTFTGTVSRL